MNKKLCLLVIFGVGSSISADQPATIKDLKSDLKIRFVDSFEAMRQCEDGQEASKKLERKREDYTKELQKDQENLIKADSDLKKKASTLSQSARDKEDQKINKMKRDLEAKAKEYEEEMQLAMQRETEQLAQYIEKGIIEVAQQEDLDAVVDKMTGRVVYAKEKVDCTAQTIKAVDKQRAQKLAQNNKDKENVQIAAKRDPKGTTTKS